MNVIPIAYVAPAESVGIVSPDTIVPTTGTLLKRLAAPIPLVAGIMVPAMLAMKDLPKFFENGIP